MNSELVVRRIKDLVETYHYRGLYFTDSNFFFDISRGREILKGLLRENLDLTIASINIDFHTLSRLNEEDFLLLQSAGCKRLPIAVESGSTRIRKLIRKPVDTLRLLQINRNLKRYNIALHYAFMMGFPTETRAELAESLTLASTLVKENSNADVSFNIFTPFPGTELFDMSLKHGLRFPEKTEDWFPFSYRNLVQGTPWLSGEMRHLVEVMDFCTFFMSNRPFVNPYEKTNKWFSFLSRLYSPVARFRVKFLWDGFPLEVRLARLFGLPARYR
jgi:radical SAM superfamily enzyme YgiQ (UPF0313 family)